MPFLQSASTKVPHKLFWKWQCLNLMAAGVFAFRLKGNGPEDYFPASLNGQMPGWKFL